MGVDAADPGQVRVVGGGPHSLAGPGAGQEQIQTNHQQGGGQAQKDIVRGDANVQGQLDELAGFPGQLPDLGIPAGLHRPPDYGPQGKGHAQGGNGKGHRRRQSPAQMAVNQPVQGGGQSRRRQDSGRQGQQQGKAESERPQPGLSQAQGGKDADQQGVGDKSAQGHKVAVGKVGKAQDTENQGYADGGQGQSAAQEQAVDQQARLAENQHGGRQAEAGGP